VSPCDTAGSHIACSDNHRVEKACDVIGPWANLSA